MDEASHLAAGRFARGYNCAQSVFSAFASQLGITSEFALRLGAPFGAGMGRAGETCGALSGALMVLGLQYATTRPEDKEEIYAITREFAEQFRQRHGTTICRELVGYDISKPEGLKAARDHDAFARICPLLVEETTKALSQYVSDHPRKPAESQSG